MISLRTIVVSLLSFAIAMFALPGLAQSPAKQHSIDVRPTSPPAPSSSSNVFVTISNETPSSGNSTINSFVITIPAGISVANPQSTPGDNPGATVEKRSDGKIYVNGFSGLKSGRRDPYYRTVKLRATYNTLACDSRFTWSSVAYTGNAFSQETFAATIGTGTPGVTNAPTNAVQSAACGYTLAIAPSSVIRGKAPTLTATITNNSSSAGSISSVTLTPPAGLSIVGSNVLPLSPAIAPGGTGTFAVPVAAPCSSTDTGGSWGALVAGFTPPPTYPSTSISGSCGLSFGPMPPSGFVIGAGTDVTVKFVDGAGATISTSAGNFGVTLVAGGSCTLSPNPQDQQLAGGTATFSVVLGGTPGSCNLKVFGTIEGKYSEAMSGNFTAYGGVLKCLQTTINALTPPPYDPDEPTTFSGSPTGITNSGQTAFMAGARGKGDDKDGTGCTDINYSIKNNVPAGSAGSLDAVGNWVPANGISFVWDRSQAPNPILTYTATFRSEWADPSTGLPALKIDPTTGLLAGKTRQCDVTWPALCPQTGANYKPVKACIGTDVVHASVPAGEKACIARETWTVIPFDIVNFPSTGGPYYCDLTKMPTAPAGAPTGWEPACVQVTTIFLDGKDPVLIRD